MTWEGVEAGICDICVLFLRPVSLRVGNVRKTAHEENGQVKKTKDNRERTTEGETE